MKTYGFVAPVLSLASSRNKPVLFSRSRNVVRRTAKRDCNTIIFMSNKAQKFVAGVAAVSIALCSAPHVAFAVNRPDLLPSSPTPVIDLAKIFPKGELKAVEDDLNDFEQETGWRIRIVASVRDATPGLAVKDFWNLKDPAVNTKTVVVLANPDAGNILNFSVGDEVYSKLPRPFWVELTNRYGNQFDVKRLGQDKALLQAVEAVKECLQRTEGCRVVPGIGQDQYALTLITSAVGGFVAGFAGRTGQREGGKLPYLTSSSLLCSVSSDVLLSWPTSCFLKICVFAGNVFSA
mmetsp:Transcript_36343/g.58765  ORF Transcript_36343/g.58765 Transcript_36343/m.58765 type:complete len:292 (-) Transcript_36343:82-957(-)